MSPAFYTEKQLTELGLGSTMSRWRWKKQGLFPKSIKLSAGRVAYDADEIHAWIEERKNHAA